MLRKGKILERLADIGIVAVVRGESVAEGVRISKACAKGGIPAIEVTYTVPGATEVIKALKEQDVNNEMIIGAGTVLDAATARIAILAGAEFIVSPAFDKETAKLCNLYQIPYMPGCMTITEMTTAMQYGADIIKLFPGSAFGPSFVKAVKAPYHCLISRCFLAELPHFVVAFLNHGLEWNKIVRPSFEHCNVYLHL